MDKKELGEERVNLKSGSCDLSHLNFDEFSHDIGTCLLK